MTLTAEQIASLPYQGDKPAGAEDVAKEIKRLCVLVASVAKAGPGGQSGADMLMDATKEPGQSVFIQETRVALALESWSSDAGKFLLTTMTEAMAQFTAESFVALHAAAHDAGAGLNENGS